MTEREICYAPNTYYCLCLDNADLEATVIAFGKDEAIKIFKELINNNSAACTARLIKKEQS